MRTECHDPHPMLVMGGLHNSGRRQQETRDVLARLAQEFQARTEASTQVLLDLEAARDGLRADVVYWDPGSEGGPVPCVGPSDLSSSWCTGLTSRLIGSSKGGADDDRILISKADEIDVAPKPVSAGMIRVSRDSNSWIVALSFTPERLFGESDLKVMSLARRLLLNHRSNLHVRGAYSDSLFDLVRCLTATIEAKDPYTCGHSERVARIGHRIGLQMGLSNAELGDIYLAGLLHDIGKIGVRDATLQKPGALTPEETAHIRRHTIVGDRMISSIRQLVHLRPGVRNHHERFDGKGYPDGLAGEEIPLLARVLAVADSCDAMMSDRPYRRALPMERIDAILAEGAGQMWDPAVVRAYAACRDDLLSIFPSGLGEPATDSIDQPTEFDLTSLAVPAPSLG